MRKVTWTLTTIVAIWSITLQPVHTFPTLPDDNMNWGLVIKATTPSNISAAGDEEGYRPISLDPIPPAGGYHQEKSTNLNGINNKSPPDDVNSKVHKKLDHEDGSRPISLDPIPPSPEVRTDVQKEANKDKKNGNFNHTAWHTKMNENGFLYIDDMWYDEDDESGSRPISLDPIDPPKYHTKDYVVPEVEHGTQQAGVSSNDDDFIRKYFDFLLMFLVIICICWLLITIPTCVNFCKFYFSVKPIPLGFNKFDI